MRFLPTVAIAILIAVGVAFGTPVTDATYASHITKLKARLPRGVFSYVVQAPFVVIGDGPPETVQEHARRTVGWAVSLLRQDYFDHDPDLLDIYLFQGKVSYDKYNRELFHNVPDTPYGYYSEVDNALVMNIATGGGTLVHEIVHPYIRRNFPTCPTWFNEGLASLYEQCGEREGHIVGYPNWRLEGLQDAIRAKRLPTLEALMRMNAGRFYADKGVHYGMARYLCYYLQQRGLLRRYYRDFVKNHTTDPAGIQTLKQVLGEVDLNSFQKRWEGFVMSLSYP